MKTLQNTFFAAALVTSLFSCQKAPLPEIDQLSNQPVKRASRPSTSVVGNNLCDGTEGIYFMCQEKTVPLTAGQHIDAGTVTVVNDNDFIYVTYSTANGYVLQETHLYVGDCEGIPVNGKGNPTVGLFPYKNTHDNLTTVTYKVPVSAIPTGTCGCIVSHASVVKLGGSGERLDAQTAWGGGTQINPGQGGWAMKFDYCSCVGGE